jgi:hypothetical protein
MLGLLVLLPLTACASTTAPSAGPGTFLEIEFVNFAWVPTWTGVVIDSAGAAYAFDLEGAPWQHAEAEYVTRAALLEKWQQRRAPREPVGSSTLAALAEKAAASEGAPLQPPRYGCNDAGTITYSTWRYDSARGAYRRTVVRREGDMAQVSTSPAGRSLGEQLAGLDFLPRIDGCTP